MDTTEVQPVSPPLVDELSLRSWNWRGELKRQERSMEWLARRTARSVNTVYLYGRGAKTPPLDWLRDAAIVLGVGVES